DTYLSVSEALTHAGHVHDSKVELVWINSEDITEENTERVLKDLDGIIAPSGFGERGTKGKILAAKYARENNVPYFGIGMGMQTAIIEFARNVLNLENAHSTEFDADTKYPVVVGLDQHANSDFLGGTLRLGNYECVLEEGSLIKKLYAEASVLERHRHRYEFNNKYRELFEENGFVFSANTPDNEVVEAVELSTHPFYIGTQYQPEFKSRPNRPHPLFKGFIHAALIFSKDKVE
ncbi:MAG: C26 family cysteine hydrolase domain-containing family, partial [Erysipelothrix sp.]|nr:C26 family cysteine hydrolase domain-containing family [Erysipelothrix sp.]